MKVDAKTEAKVEAHAVADLTMKAGDCCEGCQMNRGKRGCEGRVRGYMYMELEDAEYDALSARQLQSFSRQHHSKWVPGRICGCGFRGLVESILGRRFGAVVKIKSKCREQLSRSRVIDMCELRRGRRLSNLSAAAKPKVMLEVWWSLYLGEGLAQWSRSRAIVESSCHDQEPLSSASGH